MKKFFHLINCSTCKRILAEINLSSDIPKQDIRATPLSVKDLEAMKQLAGTYEALFSKRAKLYKIRNLRDEDLGESDFRELLLEHHTFLKRPVLVYDDRIFIGNSKNTVSEMKKFLRTI